MHELPPLPYDYNALEPYMDEQTVRIHHDKHHATYVANLNKALDKHPGFFKNDLHKLLVDLNKVPEDIRNDVRNHGGGVWNHTFFWTVIGPASVHEAQVTDESKLIKIYSAIMKDFGSLDSFNEKFKAAALSRFGSGWVWLVKDSVGKLSIVSTANQDCPVTDGLTPLLVIDLWEHAYYLKYQNRRAEFIDAFFKLINWEQVEKYFLAEELHQ